MVTPQASGDGPSKKYLLCEGRCSKDAIYLSNDKIALPSSVAGILPPYGSLLFTSTLCRLYNTAHLSRLYFSHLASGDSGNEVRWTTTLIWRYIFFYDQAGGDNARAFYSTPPT